MKRGNPGSPGFTENRKEGGELKGSIHLSNMQRLGPYFLAPVYSRVTLSVNLIVFPFFRHPGRKTEVGRIGT